MKIGQLSFMYTLRKVTALNRQFIRHPLLFMNRLTVLSANFESTVNDVLGHANSGKSQSSNF